MINDTANNTGGSGTGSGNTAGLIMSNSNPDLLIFMRSGIRTLFSDLRNVGEPQLIIDNYILTGIPPLGVQNPAVQVALGYQGYFNGYTWSNQWTLPIGFKRVLAMWERATGTGEDFAPMSPAPFGLPGVMQGRRMVHWEMREGQVWMPGCTTAVDLRMRARIGYPATFNTANLNFDTAYVPILNCGDAIAAKMLVRYAIRFAPSMLPQAREEEKEQMDKLFLETVRQMQANENQRAEFGGDAVQDFAIAWSWL
jgi:hypothetical protein